MTTDSANQYLRLSDALITFDSTIKRVYFDPINKQVFCVTNDDSNRLKVVVRCSRSSHEFTFVLEDRGEIFSLKFSPDSRILGIQRSQKAIEFANFDPDSKRIDTVEYSQPVKAKSSKILTFSWFSETEVCFVADKSVEFYAISPERRSLKALKCISVQVSWYRFAFEERMLLLFTYDSQSTLVPFTFRSGAPEKLAKVEIPTRFLVRAATRSQTLLDRDSSLIRIYGKSYYCWLRCPSLAPSNSAAQFLANSNSSQFSASPPGPNSSGSEQLFDVFLQEVKFESVGRKMHVLRTATSVRQTLNVVDNLVVIHRPTEKRSVVFDIRLVDATDDGGVHYHSPLTAPFTILTQPSDQSAVSTNTVGYRDSWLYFHPDILIDAKVGTVWQFELILDGFIRSITDRNRLVDFLLNRGTSGSKNLLCNLIRSIIVENSPNCLQQLAIVFDKLNVALKKHTDYAASLRAAGIVPESPAVGQSSSSNDAQGAVNTFRSTTDPMLLSTTSILIPPPSATSSLQLQQFPASSNFEYELVHNAQFAYAKLQERIVVVLDQYDVYVNIFLPLFENENPHHVPSKLLIAALIQYLSSLHDASVEVQHFIHNLLTTVLAQRSAFNTLQQLIQYGVIADSKQVACLLISLSTQYSPAYQLGVDMLRRLDLTNGDIFDALLVKSSNVPAALRFVHATQLRLDSVQLQNLFSKLEMQNDPLHFYAAVSMLLNTPHIRDTLSKADWFEAVQQRFTHLLPSNAGLSVSMDKRAAHT